MYLIRGTNLASADGMAILGIDPSADRVAPVYAAPGPDGMEVMRMIEPWGQGVDGGVRDQAEYKSSFGC